MLYRGRVRNGVIVLDDPVQLTEGTEIQVMEIVPPRPLEKPAKRQKGKSGLLKFAGILKEKRPPDIGPEAHADLIWLVEHPEKTIGSRYHDAGQCWE